MAKQTPNSGELTLSLPGELLEIMRQRASAAGVSVEMYGFHLLTAQVLGLELRSSGAEMTSEYPPSLGNPSHATRRHNRPQPSPSSPLAIHYTLSRRQAKELFTRASPLAIVLPMPPSMSDDDDPMEFAKFALPGLDGKLFERSEWCEVTVAPAGGMGLASVLGQIVPEGEDSLLTAGNQAGGLRWCVLACEVWLTPNGARHRRLPKQWPGMAFNGEREWGGR